MTRWVRLFIAGSVGLALLALGCAKSAPRTPRTRGPAVSLAMGAPSPDDIGATPSGDRIQISQFKGKLVLVNFWATWCPPCRAELPRLEEFHREYQDNGLEVIAVNHGEDSKTVAAFLKANPQLTLRVVLDPKKATVSRFGVTGIPTNVILDWDGNVRWAGAGYGEGYTKLLVARLNALIDERRHSKETEPAGEAAPHP